MTSQEIFFYGLVAIGIVWTVALGVFNLRLGTKEGKVAGWGWLICTGLCAVIGAIVYFASF